MMVALLVYTYAIGERSSRRIERRCIEDVATRVICANQAADHTTVSRFRQRHETALAGLFGEVLVVCAEAGLVEVGVIAINGTQGKPTRAGPASAGGCPSRSKAGGPSGQPDAERARADARTMPAGSQVITVVRVGRRRPARPPCRSASRFRASGCPLSALATSRTGSADTGVDCGIARRRTPEIHGSHVTYR